MAILTTLQGGIDPNNPQVQLEYQEICDSIRAESLVGSNTGWMGLIKPGKPPRSFETIRKLTWQLVSNLKRFSIAVVVAIVLQMLGVFNLLLVVHYRGIKSFLVLINI